MKIFKHTFGVLVLLLCTIVFAVYANPVFADSIDLEEAEKQLREADNQWINGKVTQAIPLYEKLIADFPQDGRIFQSLVSMRLANAYYQAGDNQACLDVIDSMLKQDYLPEHHFLAAEELKTKIAGDSNTNHKTDIPPIPNVSKRIYVDCGAQINGDGSQKKPLQTLDEAIQISRERKQTGFVEIVLAPGIYKRQTTIALTKNDSKIIIRSADAKRPAVLTAGTMLRKWDRVADQNILDQLPLPTRKQVLVCDLSENGIKDIGQLIFGGSSSKRSAEQNRPSRSLRIPELFYKGQPQTIARWPNDSMTYLPINETPKENAERFKMWGKEKDLWLYGYWYWDWSDAYEKVASINQSGVIALEPPTNGYGFKINQGYAVNALCEIDRAGEWHLDTDNGLIYYLPQQNFDASQCVLSSYGTIFYAENCDDLQLRNIKIEYIRGDAIVLKNCSDLLLHGIDISKCSGMGIIAEKAQNPLIHSCKVNSMGRGGMAISSGNWQTLEPGHAVIENCNISHLSRIDHTYTPALHIEGMDIKVRHNSFEHIPSSAIRMETCDALIELNYFHRCVYESGDQGAIDMWANPLYRGNVIRWNYFDRIINERGGKYGAAAIRHDDFISGFMVFENVMRQGSPHGFGSVQFNQGTDNFIEGNIIIDWHKAFSGRSVGGDKWKEVITKHSNSNRVLQTTNWQSDQWRKKYPMVRDLFNGEDNHNYLLDNLKLGGGEWGEVKLAVMFSNVDGDGDFEFKSLGELKPMMAPWRQIPLEDIGLYGDE